jgi:antitoxin YefM
MEHVMTYSEVRSRLASVMDDVCDNHRPTVITRQRNRSVVIVSLEDYETMAETFYLLNNPANAQRLTQSIQQLDQGQAQERELL